ncbi:metal-dependent hydrolase [Arachidicoccus terrestris]|uniref:metal-dependent hydrolase n=1 Tax=Arachidicoccus terrestris TaxID=2875539 RepID=UPI001CC64C37|nr:metal-dependent hydrolase [Arachidicoccus terrestris]UAY54993.1 metal-dependent hydrolase [Arachidicoccus terrestris]
MQLTYYGHASFSVVINNKHILFDPYITGNPAAKGINPDDLKADYILVTHGHGDHVSDLIAIAKRTGAKVIAGAEIADWLNAKGIENVHPLNQGGFVDFEFGELRAVNAIHSSGLPDGTYGGNPLGFVINTPEGNFYAAGDTALTMDMQLIPYWSTLDFALLPIGSNYTMSAADAVIAADFIKCNKIVGIHYNTFDIIKIDAAAAKALFEKAGKTLLLPEAGTTIDI